MCDRARWAPSRSFDDVDYRPVLSSSSVRRSHLVGNLPARTSWFIMVAVRLPLMSYTATLALHGADLQRYPLESSQDLVPVTALRPSANHDRQSQQLVLTRSGQNGPLCSRQHTCSRQRNNVHVAITP